MFRSRQIRTVAPSDTNMDCTGGDSLCMANNNAHECTSDTKEKKLEDWNVATMNHTTITRHLKYMLSIPTLYNQGHAFDREVLTSCVSMQRYEQVWIISDLIKLNLARVFIKNVNKTRTNYATFNETQMCNCRFTTKI